MTFGFVAVSDSESTSFNSVDSTTFGSLFKSTLGSSEVSFTTLVSVTTLEPSTLSTLSVLDTNELVDVASDTSFAETLSSVAIENTKRPKSTEPVIP